jgi:hypothetical protein
MCLGFGPVGPVGPAVVGGIPDRCPAIVVRSVVAAVQPAREYERVSPHMIDELVTVLSEHVDAHVAVAPAKRSALVVASPTSLTPTSGIFAVSLKVFDAIRNAPMPAIAASDGGDFGGGNELVIVSELAIAAERAQFG